jgi:hypothetical protein
LVFLFGSGVLRRVSGESPASLRRVSGAAKQI